MSTFFSGRYEDGYSNGKLLLQKEDLSWVRCTEQVQFSSWRGVGNDCLVGKIHHHPVALIAFGLAGMGHAFGVARDHQQAPRREVRSPFGIDPPEPLRHGDDDRLCSQQEAAKHRLLQGRVIAGDDASALFPLLVGPPERLRRSSFWNLA